MESTKFVVSGDQRLAIADKCWEIQRQLKLANGSPLDPTFVDQALRDIIEGRFRTAQKDQPMPRLKTEVVKAILTEIEIVPADAVEGLVLPNFYRIDGKAPDGVKIDHLGNTFLSLMAAEKEPVSVPAGWLWFSRLEQRATTEQIVNAVEPERRLVNFATAAARKSAMLRRQPKGERGKLRADGNATLLVFAEGVVFCSWYWFSGERFWIIGASMVTSSDEWPVGCEVVSL